MLVKMPNINCIHINRPITFKAFLMTDANNQNDGDGKADAVAAIAVVLIIVAGVIYWLSTV